ncbi:hypothetical protein, partial [Bradyrhizobium sp.]|uniref:hypothetical protein n=1 Tax=Bradyrhizobium sp. TaxID=376 RepID=UPI00290029CB
PRHSLAASKAGEVDTISGSPPPLTSLPHIGLFAACLALAIQHEVASFAVLELILICAAPPLAALVGLRIGRRR